MERVGYKAKNFEDAHRRDIEEMKAMTVAERFEVAAVLCARAYGLDNPSLREAGPEYARKTYRRRRRRADPGAG